MAKLKEGSTVNDVLIADETIRQDVSKPLGTEVVSSLPTSNLFDGRQILLTEDDGEFEAGYYGYFDGEWV